MNVDEDSYRNLPFENKIEVISRIAKEYHWRSILEDAEEDFIEKNDEESRKTIEDAKRAWNDGHLIFAWPFSIFEVNKESGWIRYRLTLDCPSWEEEGFDMQRLYYKLVAKKWCSISIDKEGDIYKAELFSDIITKDLFEKYVRDIIGGLDSELRRLQDYLENYREILDSD